MELDYLSIGKRLQEARKSNNLTQQELADIMGLSVSYIKSTERGNKPSIQYLFTVVDTCKVSFDWLLIGDQVSNNDDETEKILDTLRMILNDSDPEIRAWAKVQLRKAFADYFPVKDGEK